MTPIHLDHWRQLWIPWWGLSGWGSHTQMEPVLLHRLVEPPPPSCLAFAFLPLSSILHWQVFYLALKVIILLGTAPISLCWTQSADYLSSLQVTTEDTLYSMVLQGQEWEEEREEDIDLPLVQKNALGVIPRQPKMTERNDWVNELLLWWKCPPSWIVIYYKTTQNPRASTVEHGGEKPESHSFVMRQTHYFK